MGGFAALGRILDEINQGQGWRHDGYVTFEEFLEHELDISRQHAYRYIEAARVCHQLETRGLPVPANEAQARELVPLLPPPPEVRGRAILARPDTADALVEVWQAAASNGRVTAQELKLRVAAKRIELFPPPPRPEPPARVEQVSMCRHCELHCPD